MGTLTSTHNLCFVQKYEKYQNFLSEKFHFLVVNCSLYLNRHVFVMLQGRQHNVLFVILHTRPLLKEQDFALKEHILPSDKLQTCLFKYIENFTTKKRRKKIFR